MEGVRWLREPREQKWRVRLVRAREREERTEAVVGERWEE